MSRGRGGSVTERVDRRWWLALVVPLILAVAVAVSTRGTQVVRNDADIFYVAVEVDGGPLGVDGSSSAGAPPDAVVAAACRNYWDWLDDIVVDPSLAIVEDDSLVRAAELLDGPFTDDEVARDAEALRVRGEDAPGIVAALADDGVGADELAIAEDYLAALAAPPSDDARARYVTYVTSNSTSSRLLVYLDSSERALGRSPGSSILGIDVALPDGTSLVVDQQECWE